MGRGHLILALVVLAAALGAAAGATAALSWQTVGRGSATGAPLAKPKAYIAASRASALAQFGSRLTPSGRAALTKVDFDGNALVAVFGEFGCDDLNVATAGLARSGRTVTVELVPRPSAPGTVTCKALYPVYRFLAVARAALGSPLPTRAAVTVS